MSLYYAVYSRIEGTGRGRVRPAHSANVWRPGPFRRHPDYRGAVDTARRVAKSSRKSPPSIPPSVAHDGAEQKRHEGPERQISGRFARRLGCLLHAGAGPVHHVVDALLGIVHAHAGSRADDLRQIGAVVAGKALVATAVIRMRPT